MDTLHLLDHLFVAAAVGVYPLLSALRIGEGLKYLREGGEAARVRAYRENVMVWLAFSAILLAIWLHFERDLSLIGVRWPEPGTWLLGSAAALGYIGFMAWTLRNLARAEDPEAALHAQLGELMTFLPKTRREEGWFYALSGNAGLTEELIFRGYLIWYLGHMLDGLWVAVAATVLFTWAHAYQGIKLLPGIAMTSAVLVGIYIYTQSLLLPILLHAIVDGVQGRYFARFRRAALA